MELNEATIVSNGVTAVAPTLTGPVMIAIVEYRGMLWAKPAKKVFRIHRHDQVCCNVCFNVARQRADYRANYRAVQPPSSAFLLRTKQTVLVQMKLRGRRNRALPISVKGSSRGDVAVASSHDPSTPDMWFVDKATPQTTRVHNQAMGKQGSSNVSPRHLVHWHAVIVRISFRDQHGSSHPGIVIQVSQSA